MPKNIGDLGKFIVAKGFKKLPKVQINHPIWSHCSFTKCHFPKGDDNISPKECTYPFCARQVWAIFSTLSLIRNKLGRTNFVNDFCFCLSLLCSVTRFD